MMNFRSCWRSAVLTLVVSLAVVGQAQANPTLVIDIDSGEVLYHEMATAPWFPASLTKLMTTYVALSKVREGKISLDTPLRVSARAASMAPSKMGFRPGTLVTLDNALKMLMVKSPNDIAVTIAEGISGSVEAFAEEMNVYGAKLGLHESHFDNPNGLPDERHISSARDMAMIGRALFREFPEQHGLFGIAALSFGGRIINNHNNLIGRYPGVDGMKTGYTCSAGYNVVASAQRGNKHLMVVILGAPSGRERSERAAALFERYFSNPGDGAGDIAALPVSDIVMPPDMRGQICGPGRRNAIAEAEVEDANIPLAPGGGQMFGRPPERAAVLGAAAAVQPRTTLAALLGQRAPFEPVRVFIGPVPGWSGTVAGSTEAAAPGPNSPSMQAPAMASARPEPGATGAGDTLASPLALVGAVPPSAALAAANKVVKAKGRLSLRAAAESIRKAQAKKVELKKPESKKAEPKKAQPRKAEVAPAKASRAKPAAKAAALPKEKRSSKTGRKAKAAAR